MSAVSPKLRTTNSRLQLAGLGFRYGLESILNDINLELFDGERLALVGPSGCGKTTLMHLVAGLLLPTEGVCQHDFKRIRMVFQQPRLLPWQTALSNLTLGLKPLGYDASARHAAGMVMASRLGLTEDDLAKYPDQLSGGMQSRISLGRALILEPDLLLMDEPFSALDIGHKARLYDDLSRLAESRTSMIMITHDILEAVRLADRILVMAPSPGRVVADVVLGLEPGLRDDLYVHHNSALLMQQPAVRSAFHLPPLMDTSLSRETETDFTMRGAQPQNIAVQKNTREAVC